MATFRYPDDFNQDDWSDLPALSPGDIVDGSGHTFTGRLNIGTSGALGQYIEFRNFSIALLDNTDICINVQQRPYIRLRDIQLSSCRIGVQNFGSSARSMDGFECINVNVTAPSELGIRTGFIPGQSGTQVSTGILIQDCDVTNAGQQGIIVGGELNGAVIRNSTVDGANLSGTNSWGIIVTTGGRSMSGETWTAAGDAFNASLTGAGLANEDIQNVWLRSGTGPHKLVQGTFGALLINQWAQSGDTLQVRLAEGDPNGLPIQANPTNVLNAVIEYCRASNVDDNGLTQDGVAIGFDQGVEDSTIRYCEGFNSRGAFNISLGENIEVYGNYGHDSKRWNFQALGVGARGVGVRFQHNVSENPGTVETGTVAACFYMDSCSTDFVTLHNNQAIGGERGLRLTAATPSVIESHNGVFGASVDNGFVGAGTVTDDPQLAPNQFTTVSGPGYAAGLFVPGFHDVERDQSGIAFRNPPDIGLQSNLVAAPTFPIAVVTAVDAAPENISHGHTLDTPAAIRVRQANVDELTHAHTLDDAPAVRVRAADVDSVVHGQTLDQPTGQVIVPGQAQPEEIAHGHTLDAAAAGRTRSAVVDELGHGHTLDTPTAARVVTANVESLTHGHTLDTPIVDSSGVANPIELGHGHTLDAPVAVRRVFGNVVSIAHGHTLDSPLIRNAAEFADTPPSREVRVARTERTVLVARTERTVRVAA